MAKLVLASLNHWFLCEFVFVLSQSRVKCTIDNEKLKHDNARLRSEGFPSGQRGQTVNLLAQPSKVRILPPPPNDVVVFLGRFV